MIEKAVKLLKAKNVVGMPTETVYGLAGSIESEEALKKIFQIKERPFFDPLIVHVASVESAKSLVKKWPRSAELLAQKFWPGPLTLVLEKNDKVSDLITSGLNTVALRMPNHPMALELIKKCGFPLAAPSANKFGRTSPTTASHVASEFNQEVFVLDGGPCQIGLESTVMSVSENDKQETFISILRAGHIKLTDIKKFLEQNNVNYKVIEGEKKNSPGQMKHHYMPKKPLVILEEGQDFSKAKEEIKRALASLPATDDHVQLVKPTQTESYSEMHLSDNPSEAARELYFKLRLSCEDKADVIIFRKKNIHQGESWEALLDRLYKAASVVI